MDDEENEIPMRQACRLPAPSQTSRDSYRDSAYASVAAALVVVAVVIVVVVVPVVVVHIWSGKEDEALLGLRGTGRLPLARSLTRRATRRQAGRPARHSFVFQ